ncbi:MAG: hypothetical protein LBP76_00320 [Treponema sp.]|jgi:hypothetical protein|nr:hypothetical protein [Treponema sp.]
MGESNEFQIALNEVITARREWLDKSELPKLKEQLRIFQMAYGSLYKMFLKRGLINEDPYKAEAKIGEIETPETDAFPENERMEKLGIRLADYDNQLDFLVNFYQFSAEFLTLERIKKILSLIKYIDWQHLIPDASQPNTRAVAEITNQLKIGCDTMSLSVINESLSNLIKSTEVIRSYLKTLTEFNREAYKLALRNEVFAGLSPADAAQMSQVKRKFAAVNKGKAFYPDLAEEIIRENNPKSGAALREKLLNTLKIEENKPRVAKAQVSFKVFLIEGIQVIGSIGATLGEIGPKLDENEMLLENRKKGFWDKVRRIVQQMMNREPDPVIYQVEYMDPIKAVPVREKVNFSSFRMEMDRKIRILSNMNSRGNMLAKLDAMPEEQLISILERTIRDMQNLHKILSALDEFFKTSVDKGDREKVKGIKPELASMKNAIVRANQKRHDYSAQKEEEEQLRRLGVNTIS